MGSLTAKVGPLPVWAWGAIVGGGLFAYSYISSRGTPSASQAATDSPSGVDTATGTPTLSRTPLPRSTGLPKPPKAPTETRRQWIVKATDYLMAHGIAPLAAEGALVRYSNGGTLSYHQGQLVNRAIKEYGPPPGILRNVQVKPKPKPAARKSGVHAIGPALPHNSGTRNLAK